MQLQFIVALLVVLALCEGCAGMDSWNFGNDKRKSTNFTSSSKRPKSKGNSKQYSSGDGSQTMNQNSWDFGGSNDSTHPGMISFQPVDPNTFSEIVNLPPAMLSSKQVTTKYSKEMEKEHTFEDTKKTIRPFEKLGLKYFKMGDLKSAGFYRGDTTINVENDAPAPRIGHAFEGTPGLQNFSTFSRDTSNFSSTPMDQSKNYGIRRSSSGSKWLWRK